MYDDYDEEGQPGVRAFDSIPDEVLLMIFSNLSHYDIVKNCGLVCHRWHDVAMSKCLWRKLSFGKASSAETIRGVLSMAKAPTSIKLHRRRDIHKYRSLLYDRSKGLEHLTVRDCNIRWGSLSYDIVTLISNCKILKSLNIENTLVDDEAKLFEAIALLENLTTLNAKCGLRFEYSIYSALGRALPKLVHLSSLRVNRLFRSESEFSEFITKLSSSSVEHLEINVLRLSDESLSLLSQCQQLRSLQLYYAFNLGPKGINAIGNLQNMSSLFIDGQGYRDKVKIYAHDLAEAFKTGKLRNLTTFALTNCVVDSNSVNDVALFCAIGECCRFLRNVSLRESAVASPEGLVALKNACPELRLLDLYRSKMSCKLDVKMLQAVIENLRVLIISKSYFSNEVCGTILEWEKKNSGFFIAKIGAVKAGQIDKVFLNH